MRNDSIETLVARHYGSTAPTPSGLEQRLCTAVHQQATELQQQQFVATHLRTRSVSRRRAMHLVAVGSASLGVLSLGLEGLAAIVGQDAPQAATP